MYTTLAMETGMALGYERDGHVLTTKRPIMSLARLAKRLGQSESINR